MPHLSRRELVAGLAGAAALAQVASGAPAHGPKAIASANGLAALDLTITKLKAGADPLDAVLAGIAQVEDDPNDNTVGFGGLPNEDGVVELDSSVMHGPSAKAGAVAALRNIRHPSAVAKLVMERTDHVLLVGEGALRFARAHGFKEEDLLTDASRRAWLRWKENLSEEDDWVTPPDPLKKATPQNRGPTTKEDDNKKSARGAAIDRPTGTVHISAIDAKANLAGCTSTSGLAFKIAGRVGDSPIIGAGLYVDNQAGAAGSTGRGEANLVACSSYLIVEAMRQGKAPTDACLLACQRVVELNRDPRLQRKDGKPAFDVRFYALSRTGAHGGASLYPGEKYAFHDGRTGRLHDCASLFERKG